MTESEVVREVRAELNRQKVQQSVLAEQVGLSRTAINNLLNGRQSMSLRNFLNISAALGLTPDYFFRAAQLREMHLIGADDA